MPIFKLEFDCDNEVFEAPYTADAVADVLLQASKTVRQQGLSADVQWLRDNNGNLIGTFQYQADETGEEWPASDRDHDEWKHEAAAAQRLKR